MTETYTQEQARLYNEQTRRIHGNTAPGACLCNICKPKPCRLCGFTGRNHIHTAAPVPQEV